MSAVNWMNVHPVEIHLASHLRHQCSSRPRTTNLEWMTHAWRCGLVTGYNLEWAVPVITIQIVHGCQGQYYGWLLYICLCTMSVMLVSHFSKIASTLISKVQWGTGGKGRERWLRVTENGGQICLTLWSVCEINKTFFWITFAFTTPLHCRPIPEH